MITVKGAIKAFLRACFITILAKDTPFRRAVLMYCAVITSAIDALVILAMYPMP